MPEPILIGDLLAAALARVDGCPCGNTEPARAAVPIDGGWMTSHLCTDCSHAWTREWKTETD